MGRPRRQQGLIPAILIVAFLTGCSAPTATPTLAPSSTLTPSPTLTSTPSPTSTQTLVPTSTPDLVMAQRAATLFEQGFESGTALGILDSYGNWSVSLDSAGNHILCNDVSEDWQSFRFGLEAWTDYAVEVRVEFLEENADRSAEVYARVNSSTDGYRATLSYGWAGLAYYPPAISLGGTSMTTRANTWYTLRVEAGGNRIKFYIDDRPIADAKDSRRLMGMAGFGAGPNTRTCVDDIRIWALTQDGQIVSTSPLAKYEGECQFCFLEDEGPLAPVPETAHYGFTYRSGDPREIVTIDENFGVQAGEHITFEDKIILIEPAHRRDIEVYGTLTMRNCLMIWRQTGYGQTHLRVKRGGTLIIKDSYSFWGNQYWVNWDYEDGSTVRFDHFVGDPWTTIRGSVDYTAINYSTVKLTFLRGTHDTTVLVSNAHHVWFEVFPPEGTYTFTLPAKRQWADWNIPDLWPNTTVQVRDSYIYERDISLSPNTHVTIEDTPSGFGLGWQINRDTPGYVNCELRNLGEPGNAHGVYYESMTWDLPCINSSLTVRKSRLQRAWGITWGPIHLKFFDSCLVDLHNSGGGATLEIYNSTVDIAKATSGGRIYLEWSPINEAIDVSGPNSVIYGFGVTGGYELLEADGGAYIALDEPGPPWE